MRKFLIIVGIVFLAVLLYSAVVWGVVLIRTTHRTGGGEPIVTLSNHKSVVIIETARTEQERAKGLSGRPRLNPNQGMWFAFDQPGYYPFWMKDMEFSIDIIWLEKDEKGRDYQVVDIKRNLEPAQDNKPITTYTNTRPAQYVLEVLAGVSEGVDIGDHFSMASRV